MFDRLGGTNTDSIRRLVGVSEGEKHRILEKEDQTPSRRY